MEIKKKKLEENELNKVNGGTDNLFNEDGTVKDTLKPKDVTLYTASIISDQISPTIPSIDLDE